MPYHFFVRNLLHWRRLSAAALIIFTIFLFPYAAHAREKALTILYTGAIKGELEPCGCSPDTQSGGLARLSGYISANKKALSPYVLVDAGNTFADATPQGKLKNEAILSSFALMGYDAAALPSNKAVKAVKSGLRVNISSDEKLAKKGMINILLSGKQVSELKAVKGWDVMISSSGEELTEPVASGKAVIVSGFPRGQKLGILSLKLDRKGKVIGWGHRWQALKQDVAEDPAVRAVLKDYDQKVAALLKEEELKPVTGGQYLGFERCVECHQPYVESWKSTKHSAAFATLDRVGKSKDPECVKCHTVGFGEEGGFLSLKATPGLANVQCESCHGPGREHAADFSPMRQIGVEVCLKCHTHENSPEFDFQKYFEKIKH